MSYNFAKLIRSVEDAAIDTEKDVAGYLSEAEKTLHLPLVTEFIKAAAAAFPSPFSVAATGVSDGVRDLLHFSIDATKPVATVAAEAAPVVAAAATAAEAAAPGTQVETDAEKIAAIAAKAEADIEAVKAAENEGLAAVAPPAA